MNARIALWLGVALSTATVAVGESFAIDWFTTDGGGGTSTGGVFDLSGTIGQPDAGRISGGNYVLEGGFCGVLGDNRERNQQARGGLCWAPFRCGFA